MGLSTVVLLLATVSLANGADDISLDHVPALRLSWRKNITLEHAGYAFLPDDLGASDTLLVTAFDGTPIFGKRCTARFGACSGIVV